MRSFLKFRTLTYLFIPKHFGNPVNGGPKLLYPLSSRVSRVSAMVSFRFSGIWDRRPPFTGLPTFRTLGVS